MTGCLFLAAALSSAKPVGETLPLLSVLPFAGILLSIALFPLIAPRLWHRHHGKISLFWAVSFALPFLVSYPDQAPGAILHTCFVDYLPFVVLLFGLFTAAGGIVVRGTPPVSAGANTVLLAAGTALASIVGTTGASMLLIRPLLRSNAGREHRTHTVVFFLFLVSNIGGSLTPLGDPPLLLLFLHGVPFFWTLSLLPSMAFLTVALLALFFLVDRHLLRAERREDPDGPKPKLRVEVLPNLACLAGIVAAVLLSGIFEGGSVSILGVPVRIAGLLRDAAILGLGVLSLATTSKALRRENGFSFGPMCEVAVLFAGIFVTILPALAILGAGERGALAPWIGAVETPRQYFWAAGLLSSFLDNAPTALSFFYQLLGRFHPGQPETAAVAELVRAHGAHLGAIAAGAVFMGANTYIGNAPNFLVKAIAEESGVAMPSFLGYIVRWSLPILVPLLGIASFLFF